LKFDSYLQICKTATVAKPETIYCDTHQPQQQSAELTLNCFHVW